jgi:O-antigen ligase
MSWRQPQLSKSHISLMPVLAVSFPAIIQPLIYLSFPPAAGLQGLLESRIENRIFWPALAFIVILVAAQNWTRLNRLSIPPNIAALLAYLAFAGASVVWSFNPTLSFIRFVQEVMVLTAIVLPALLAPRHADIMYGVFLCFGLAAAVNILLIPGGYVSFAQYGSALVEIGYRGYFTGKNLLGEFAAVTCLLSFYQSLLGGKRRFLGIIVGILACTLLFLSNSKTALALTPLSPVLAGILVLINKRFRISPAVVMCTLAFICVAFCQLTDFNTGRIAYMLTGDSSFTGRATIWNFAEMEIARQPVLGWGYQAFWLSGPNAPSIVDAPGWVKSMPNAHNGYYDTMLELGYVGLAFLTVFLVSTLHMIGEVAKRNFGKAWLLLSIALFIMLYDFLETLWLRAFDLLWVVFVIVAVEAARYWRVAPAPTPPQLILERTVRSRALPAQWTPRWRRHKRPVV